MTCINCGAEIPNGSAFCPECGAKIQTNKKPIMMIAIVSAIIVLVVITVSIVIINNRNKHKAEAIVMEEKAKQDSINAANFAIEQVRLEEEQKAVEAERLRIEEEKQALSKTTSVNKITTHSLSYGSWTGTWKNGQPNGIGTLKYTKQHLIDKRDRKKRVADPGEYIIGEFVEGKLVQGTLYDTNNNVKATIVLGL